MNTETIRRIKIADLLVQVLILATVAIVWFIDADTSFILLYAVLGIWQILSCVVHLFIPRFRKITLRSIYQYLLLLIVACVLLGLLIDTVIIYTYLTLLFITPVMGLYYLVLSGLEYQQLVNEARS